MARRLARSARSVCPASDIGNSCVCAKETANNLTVPYTSVISALFCISHFNHNYMALALLWSSFSRSYAEAHINGTHFL